MWTLDPYQPPDFLAQYIQFYWVGKVPLGIVMPVAFLPPTGYSSLLLSYGKKHLKLRNHGKQLVETSRAIVMGQYFNNLESHIPQGLEMIGILFKPTVFHRFFGVNMLELTHNILPAEDIFGEDILHLVDKLANAHSDPMRLMFVDAYFTTKFRETKYKTELVDDVITLMVERKGDLRMQQIADYFNLSPRLLQKKFNDHTGVSPKYMGRIIQFNYVLEILKSNPKIKWAELALLAGYYDQAHLINAFIEFTGTTPVQYEQNDNDITQFYL
jgi:AraC-like DNA-binding protein